MQIGTSQVGRNFLRNAHPQIFLVHTNPIEQTAATAPFLQNGADRCFRGNRSGVSTLDTIRPIPHVNLVVPGCLGARRFAAIDGQPEYLTVCDFVPPNCSKTRGRQASIRIYLKSRKTFSTGANRFWHVVPAATIEKAARSLQRVADTNHGLNGPLFQRPSPPAPLPQE